MQTWRGPIATGLPSLLHRPAALVRQPANEGADRIGQRLVDPPIHDASVVAIGPGHRQSDDRRPPRDVGPPGLERNVGGLASIRAGVHDRCEGRIDEGLQRWEAAEACVEVEEFRAGCEQSLFHLLVDSDVRTAEAVDRLLGIADQEQLSRNGTDIAPVGLARIIGGEQQEDLGLEWIGILELVDEEVGKALLQLGANAAVVSNEVARLDQEIEEIEAAGASLQFFIGADRRLQRLLKKRRKVRITGGDECAKIVLDLIPLGQHLVTCESAVTGALSPLPAPASCASEITE